MSRRPTRLLVVVLLLALPAARRLLYDTWDPCGWLGCEAAGIPGEEVGLAADEMPDMNRRSDGSFPTIHFRIRR